MATLLIRLTDEFTTRLDSINTSDKNRIIDILNSQSFWTDLTMKQAFDLMIYFNLSSLNDVVNIFETKTQLSNLKNK